MNTSGILLLDKPSHITSNAALQKVKCLYAAKKAGHTGTLDPLATGMLAICLGEATKFTQYLLNADKVYEVEASLGVNTTTGDVDGEVTKTRPIPELNKQTLQTVLQQFTGNIQQRPPMYSAIKHAGQPLYKLARKNIQVERAMRPVTIHQLQLLDYQDSRLTLRVSCSKGTYIRTLVEDIAEQLTCGACVSQLRRLSISPYQERQMISLSELQLLAEQGEDALQQHVLPVTSALSHLPDLRLDKQGISALYNGQAVPVSAASEQQLGLVRLSLAEGDFVGVGEILTNHQVRPRRLLQKPSPRKMRSICPG